MFCLFCPKSDTKKSISLQTGNEELQARVDSLTDDEAQVYKWLLGYYSERWIAETIFVSKAQLKGLLKSLYRKLGVSGTRTLLRIYGHLKFSTVPAPVSTEEIDGYVEMRTEKEIQRHLEKNEPLSEES